LKDTAQIPHPLRVAAHPEPMVRREAARQLGRTYVREAGSALLDLMKDDDDDVRQQAEQCLKRIVS
jgi:HEAT repeat protein